MNTIYKLPLFVGIIVSGLLLFTSASSHRSIEYSPSPCGEGWGGVFPLPDTIDAHGQDLVLLRLTHYNIKGDTLTGEMIVNRRMADATCAVFRDLYEMRYPIERMTLAQQYEDDEASMRANNTSAYLYRTVAGTRRLSKHAQGLAIDINPLYNPCFKVVNGRAVNVQPATAVRYTDRRRTYPCTVTPQVVRVFKRHGFTWGGDWRSKKDYQHFELKE